MAIPSPHLKNLKHENIWIKFRDGQREPATRRLPIDLTPAYERAISRAAGMCTVKRHMEKPPAFVITTRNGG
jgi:hypothetical protein